MKDQMLKEFDSLMSHLNSEENGMAEGFREKLAALFNTKRLYILSGGTDGYISAHFTFKEEIADRALDENPEAYPDSDCLDSIKVPAWVDYADLGISYCIEEDMDEEEDEE